ncbi:hypothetical protein [Bartonella pachyuromydis]
MAWPRYVMNEHDEAIFLDVCFLQYQKNDGKTYAILFDEAPVGLLSFNRIDSGNKIAYIGYWLLAIGYWLLAIGYWLLAIGYWLLAIGLI